MSNVILCEKPISEMPFFLESISKHIYSMEELYYFIYSNPYLAAWDLMKEDFCKWLEKNYFKEEFVCELKKILQENQTQSKFLKYFIRNTNYYTKMEKEELEHVFDELENKTMLECLKMKADHLMQHKKFIYAMKEYKKILSSEEIKIIPSDIVGNIWNNLGTAYANMFFYEEAVWCFKKAYAYNNHPKSLQAMESAKMQADEIQKKLIEINEFYRTQKGELQDSIFQRGQQLTTDSCAKYDQVLLKWKKEYLNMSDLKDWSSEF